VWENQYAEAQQRFEQHQAQVIKSREADAQAETEDAEPDASVYRKPDSHWQVSGAPAASGALASDEALAALREKLAGG
ncbi:30S ribosomal protein S1, partial [Streptomyces sp. NPDC001914]